MERFIIKLVILFLVLYVKAEDVPESNPNVTVASSSSSNTTSDENKTVKLTVLKNDDYDTINAVMSSANLMAGENYAIVMNKPGAIKTVKVLSPVVKPRHKVLKTVRKSLNNPDSKITVIKQLTPSEGESLKYEIVNGTDGDTTHHKWSIKSENMTLNNTIILGANKASDTQIEFVTTTEGNRYNKHQISSSKVRGKQKFSADSGDGDDGSYRPESSYEESDNYPDLAKFNKRVEEVKAERFQSHRVPDIPPRPTKSKVTPILKMILAEITSKMNNSDVMKALENSSLTKYLENKNEQQYYHASKSQRNVESYDLKVDATRNGRPLTSADAKNKNINYDDDYSYEDEKISESTTAKNKNQDKISGLTSLISSIRNQNKNTNVKSNVNNDDKNKNVETNKQKTDTKVDDDIVATISKLRNQPAQSPNKNNNNRANSSSEIAGLSNYFSSIRKQNENTRKPTVQTTVTPIIEYYDEYEEISTIAPETTTKKRLEIKRNYTNNASNLKYTTINRQKNDDQTINENSPNSYYENREAKLNSTNESQIAQGLPQNIRNPNTPINHQKSNINHSTYNKPKTSIFRNRNNNSSRSSSAEEIQPVITVSSTETYKSTQGFNYRNNQKVNQYRSSAESNSRVAAPQIKSSTDLNVAENNYQDNLRRTIENNANVIKETKSNQRRNTTRNRGAVKYVPTKFETISPFVSDAHVNRIYSENGASIPQSNRVVNRNRGSLKHTEENLNVGAAESDSGSFINQYGTSSSSGSRRQPTHDNFASGSLVEPNKNVFRENQSSRRRYNQASQRNRNNYERAENNNNTGSEIISAENISGGEKSTVSFGKTKNQHNFVNDITTLKTNNLSGSTRDQNRFGLSTENKSGFLETTTANYHTNSFGRVPNSDSNQHSHISSTTNKSEKHVTNLETRFDELNKYKSHVESDAVKLIANKNSNLDKKTGNFYNSGSVGASKPNISSYTSSVFNNNISTYNISTTESSAQFRKEEISNKNISNLSKQGTFESLFGVNSKNENKQGGSKFSFGFNDGNVKTTTESFARNTYRFNNFGNTKNTENVDDSVAIKSNIGVSLKPQLEGLNKEYSVGTTETIAKHTYNYKNVGTIKNTDNRGINFESQQGALNNGSNQNKTSYSNNKILDNNNVSKPLVESFGSSSFNVNSNLNIGSTETLTGIKFSTDRNKNNSSETNRNLATFITSESDNYKLNRNVYENSGSTGNYKFNSNIDSGKNKFSPGVIQNKETVGKLLGNNDNTAHTNSETSKDFNKLSQTIPSGVKSSTSSNEGLSLESHINQQPKTASGVSRFTLESNSQISNKNIAPNKQILTLTRETLDKKDDGSQERGSKKLITNYEVDPFVLQTPKVKNEPIVYNKVKSSVSNLDRGGLKWTDTNYDHWNSELPSQFSYSYDTPTGIYAHQEGLLKDGRKGKIVVMKGMYQYTAPDGTPITVHYTADEFGYHPEISGLNGSNDPTYFKQVLEDESVLNPVKDNNANVDNKVTLSSN